MAIDEGLTRIRHGIYGGVGVCREPIFESSFYNGPLDRGARIVARSVEGRS